MTIMTIIIIIIIVITIIIMTIMTIIITIIIIINHQSSTVNRQPSIVNRQSSIINNHHEHLGPRHRANASVPGPGVASASPFNHIQEHWYPTTAWTSWNMTKQLGLSKHHFWIIQYEDIFLNSCYRSSDSNQKALICGFDKMGVPP